jgi:hypothetical protein
MGLKSIGGFRYQTGNGAPGSNIAHGLPYLDVSGPISFLYVYNAGAWHNAGTFVDWDATSIQGVNMNSAAPSNGQVLTYNGTDWIGV